MVQGGGPDLRAAGDALTDQRRVAVIFNPASGRGRGRRRIATYQRLLKELVPQATAFTSTRPGEEASLARRALEEGADVVVAAGGDGTWSNVADQVLASGRPEVAFGMLPNGTGNDFGRNLGFDPADAAEAVRVLAAGHTRQVDVGYMSTPSAAEASPERMESRHFLNLVGFGFDVAVIDAAAGARFLRGELLYKVTALQQLFRFPGFQVGVAGKGGGSRSGRHLMLTVSNGRYFGGGFPIAPDATTDDGKLHACAIGDAAPLTRLRLFNLAERGRHVATPQVEIMDDQAFTLTFPKPPRFEMDGDVRQASTATLSVRVLPKALTVVVPA